MSQQNTVENTSGRRNLDTVIAQARTTSYEIRSGGGSIAAALPAMERDQADGIIARAIERAKGNKD
ncbi:hypothetical protein [Arthrobacter russicus]|jgi:hypothetical protein|uniref:Pyrroline-5-carboxylate reductase n=1 Tax=Arthrobacter russicus TaxID=172040 RepID=A0ABU1J704_9MICC|nr:hypothetical protein [Arthrobacter russicus]MDN5668459.1 hypothetical protein [Renibacterium salmoninarum]MDR6268185.1 pyrroline-5-carboxylate reductase [Arthrobacter russicus]